MTSYSDSITTAIRDGEDLVGWAEPNTAVFNDERTETALLDALSAPVPPELAMSIPLLRFANRDIEAVPLMHGVFTNFAEAHRSQVCDRCQCNGVFNMPQLLVPMGASAVVLNVCAYCRHTLDARYPGLVWNA